MPLWRSLGVEGAIHNLRRKVWSKRFSGGGIAKDYTEAVFGLGVFGCLTTPLPLALAWAAQAAQRGTVPFAVVAGA